ncbi:MAG: acyl-CoA dehydrogenase family protein [Myxococcota bacterium]
MDLALTEEQQAYRKLIRDFIRAECPPSLDREIEANARFPEELMPKLAATGLFGLCFPEEYGGLGGSAIDFALAVEELAYGSEAATACYLLPVFFAGQMILLNGSESQKQHYLPRIIAGELKGAFALTEPEAGSDASAVRTRAGSKGSGFVIEGHKHFISGADVADCIMTVTRTGPERHGGLTIFMVPRRSRGLSIRKAEKLGSRCMSLCEIFYDGVEVDREEIIGGPEALNRGWPQMMASLDMERIMVAATMTAVAQKSFDAALAYAKERVQFGRPIGRNQMIQLQLVNMAIDIEAGRNLVYKAAWRASQGQKMAMEGSIAKVFCTEMATRVTQSAMQVMGGQSYLMESDIQRWARIALLGPIGMGSNNIQRLIVAGNLGLTG